MTPEYAAPEQLTGEDVTTATDVYALGVLLYLLLSGRHPAGERMGFPAELIHAVMHMEPRRLSDSVEAGGDKGGSEVAARRASTPRKLRAALRGDLENILAKALKKRPAERYTSAEAFADDLRRYLNHLPVHARPDSLGYRTRKFVLRHRLVLGAAAAVAVALATSAWMASRQARASARERDRALLELQRAEATNGFNRFLLQEAVPSAGRPLSNDALLARADTLVERRFARDPALRVHMLLLLADRYYENTQFDRWQATLDRAYSLSRGLPDVELRAQAACDKAYGMADQGHFAEADRLLTAALADLAALPDATAAEAKCRMNESITASRRGDGARAVRAAERAVQLEQGRKGPPGSGFEARAALATAYLVSGRTASADRAFRQLVGLLESEGLEGGRDAATIFHNWSVSLQRAGQHLQALPIAQRAVDIARERDAEHGASASLLVGLGIALRMVGRNEEAIPLLEESVPKAKGSGSPRRLVGVLMELATAYREAGRLGRAANALREAEKVLESDATLARSGYPAQIDGRRACLALAEGRPAEALVLAQQAVTRLQEPDHSDLDVLFLTTVLAEAQIANTDFEGAAASARRALDLANAVLREGELQYSSDAGHGHLVLGLALAGRGDLTAGRNEVLQALNHLRPSLGAAAPLTRRAQLELDRLGASPAPR